MAWGWIKRWLWPDVRDPERENPQRPRIKAREPERKKPLRLRYFDEILPVEHRAIEARRSAVSKRLKTEKLSIKPILPEVRETLTPKPPSPPPGERRADHDDVRRGGPKPPDPHRSRPRPTPCNVTGLALSGGGIRSAAFCLGALQGLNNHRAIESIDYLSTVSGGGYVGTCMTATMSKSKGVFPFGDGASVQDSPAVGHLRNYSNYLMPRAHNGVRNLAEATAIILRGLIANAALVLTTLLGLALLTTAAYPTRASLTQGSFALRLLDVLPFSWWTEYGFSYLIGRRVFGFTVILLGLLVVSLFYWARHKSLTEVQSGDTRGWHLRSAHWLLVVLAIIAFLDLQPVLIDALASSYENATAGINTTSIFNWALGVLAAVGGLVALLSSSLGRFLETSEHATELRVLIARVAARAALLIAALALPLLLLAAYLYLSAWSILDPKAIWNPFFAHGVGSWKIYLFVCAMMLLFAMDFKSDAASPAYVIVCAAFVAFWALYVVVWLVDLFGVPSPFAEVTTVWKIYLGVFIPLLILCFAFKPNAYSLHQFYRDRLSKAFLFDPKPDAAGDLNPLDDIKLSKTARSQCPYQIINAALNIQGSAEANKRGRDADFFTFTRDFVGSDLTLFGPTRAMASTTDMEYVDKNLNLGCAMAISGAALSSNMGGNTVRLMSPTLALLNIRLGYWMRNPRDLAKAGRERRRISNWLAKHTPTGPLARAALRLAQPPQRRPRRWINNLLIKFYLLPEMFNLLHESSRNILLTDGGHIENLGIYELLKRGCQLIIAVDAEADPSMSFSSFIKLQRYARIDLGVRIELPWEEIARVTHRVSRRLAQESGTDSLPVCEPGPHCAIGRILYDTGAEGILVYIKSSLTGDEKDYVLDYKKRNPLFPHESTGDQFFTEEQFEVYRALGFHAVEGFFNNEHTFSWSRAGRTPWRSEGEARAAVRQLLLTLIPAPVRPPEVVLATGADPLRL